MTIVQSLWVGPELSKLEIYSIRSYLKTGHTFHLYTYEKVKNIPKGTIIKDGNQIIPKKELFIYKESYLPFADIFRYKLLYEKGNYWVDLDMIALKKLDFKEPFVFSSERTIQKGAYKNSEKYLANIGVLKAPKNSEFYKELYLNCIKKTNITENIQFMRTMRNLLEKYKYQKYVKKPKVFCPLDWWHTKDAFYPPCCSSKYGVKGYSVTSIFKNSYSIHFWRSIMKKRDLNNLDFLDLSTMITDNEEALQNLKFQKAMQQLEDPLQIKSLKKDIAQLKTIMKEFDLGLRGNKDKK